MKIKNTETTSDNWNSVKVGDLISFTKTINQSMVDSFVSLTGDNNPLHQNYDFAQSKGFPGLVVHGMLLGAFFSTLVGKHFLRDDNFYLSQTLDFKKAVFVGETITVSGIVKHKIESVRVLEIDTVIKNANNEDVVTGQARVKFL